MYSCYFSPTDPFGIFEIQIFPLKKASEKLVGGPLSRATLIVSRPSMEKPVCKRRGILVGEIVARNYVIVLNRGRYFMFRREVVGGSIIELTIAAPLLDSRIGDWCIFDVITLSDHQCIEFSIQEGSHPVNAGRGGKERSPSWNTRRLRKAKIQKQLEETRLIDELGWAKSAGSLEDTVRAARQKVVVTCAAGIGVLGTRYTGGTTSCLSCVGNDSQHGRDLPAQRVILYCTRHGK